MFFHRILDFVDDFLPKVEGDINLAFILKTAFRTGDKFLFLLFLLFQSIKSIHAV